MKKKLCIWIPIIIIVPSLFIFLMSLVIHMISSLNKDNAVLIFDFTKGMTIAEYLGIYAALIGAEVTVFLSFVIYGLSENKERVELQERKNNARIILWNEANLYWTKIGEYIKERDIKNNIPFSKAKLSVVIFEMNEEWDKNLLLIRKDLPIEEYNFLFEFFTDVKSLLLDKDLYKFLRKFTLPFFINGLSYKDMNYIYDFKSCQSYDLYISLNSLIGGDKKERSCNYSNGNQFYIEKDKGQRYLVNTADEKKIYDYDFNTKTGFGIKFANDQIVAEGDFIAGKQVSGITYNAICDENGNYIKDSNGSLFTPLNIEYNPSNRIHRIIADFEIIEGKYVRKSEIKFVQMFY